MMAEEESGQFLPIGRAADRLGVSIQTLRRWDRSGKLVAVRTAGGHRLFKEDDICLFLNDPSVLAQRWATLSEPITIPPRYFFSEKAKFEAGLEDLARDLARTPDLMALSSLVVSVAGEIGNNSFDHNLANWPDVRGIFFAWDIKAGYVVLADRGQGVLKTLRRAKPELVDDAQALKVAFTEIISGRVLDNRGNGLKYVKKVVTENDLRLIFRTGDAWLELKGGDTELTIQPGKTRYGGCFAQIFYKI